MTKLKLAIAGVLLSIVSYLVGSANITQNYGNASGNVARVYTNTTSVPGNTSIVTIFAAKNMCATRVISTVGVPIRLSFDSGLTPTINVGILQAASTTATYPSDVYGCGAVTGFAEASTTITIAELIW
jgi:hypothetical protein